MFRGRASSGHLVAVTAGLLAILVNFALLRSRDDVFLVAAADRDLGRGTTATADAFRLVEVQVGSDVLATLVAVDELEEVEGRIVARSISEGELVAISDFAQAAAPMGHRAMSIPVDRVHAAGGAISDADVVDVIAVVDGVAAYVVLAAPVLDVAPSSASGLGSSGQFFVTLAVESATALRIAHAMDGGTIEIIRSTGASEPTQLVYPEFEDTSAEAPAEGGPGAGG
ncbi:MAG: RcpC/CpaB family pilus assembly protein [Acidimicrobiia bacterium]|nr:RcpC/CpaB family pilus assembly protein [Acidimicrobiia bacterium]